jgi:replicative DNA helicase
VSEQTPSQTLEAERAVLASILLDNESLHGVREQLEDRDFHDARHAALYRAMCALDARSVPIDGTTLRNELQLRGDDKRVPLELILGLTNTIPLVANVEAHALVVHERAALRRLSLACAAIAQETLGELDSVRTFLDDAEARILAATQLRRTGARSSERIGAISARRYGELERDMREGRPPGLPTGILGLDELLAGLHPGHMLVLGGQPGQGKSALVGTIAAEVARQGRPVLWWSGEMPREDLCDRVLAAASSVDGGRIRGVKLVADDWTRLVTSVEAMQAWPLEIDDAPAITLHQLRAKARRVRRELGGLALVVVDYLQLMRSGERHEKREEEVAAISRGLKALAGELACTVIAVTTLVKPLREARDKRPHLGDVRESGMIGFDANAVLFVYRDEVYHRETVDRGIAEIIIAKQRGGPTGTVRTAFTPGFTRFDNLEDWREPEHVASPPRRERARLPYVDGEDA